jgi:hypothetical protein
LLFWQPAPRIAYAVLQELRRLMVVLVANPDRHKSRWVRAGVVALLDPGQLAGFQRLPSASSLLLST